MLNSKSGYFSSTDPVYTVGYFAKVSHGWEGWFRWFPLKDETAHIRYDVGHGTNDPFFIVRNEAEGKYFIGHLAWTANWEMDFKSAQDLPGGRGMPGLSREANLWFKIGPWASTCAIVTVKQSTRFRSRIRKAASEVCRGWRWMASACGMA
jgi:hypothetical protein